MPARTVKFREYLEAIRRRRNATKRVEDWKGAFGDIAVFDRELTAYARKMV